MTVPNPKFTAEIHGEPDDLTFPTLRLGETIIVEETGWNTGKFVRSLGLHMTLTGIPEADIVLSAKSVEALQTALIMYTDHVALRKMHLDPKTAPFPVGARVRHTLSDRDGTVVEKPVGRFEHANATHPIVHWDGNSPDHLAAVPPSHLVRLEML